MRLRERRAACRRRRPRRRARSARPTPARAPPGRPARASAIPPGVTDSSRRRDPPPRPRRRRRPGIPLGHVDRPAQRLEDRRVEDGLIARDDPEDPEEQRLRAAHPGLGREMGRDEPRAVLEDRAGPGEIGERAGRGRRRRRGRPVEPAGGRRRERRQPVDEVARQRRGLSACSPARASSSPSARYITCRTMRTSRAFPGIPAPRRGRAGRWRLRGPVALAVRGHRSDARRRRRSARGRDALAACRPGRETFPERPPAHVRGRERRGLLVRGREEADLPVDAAALRLRPDPRPRRRGPESGAAPRLDRRRADDLRLLLPRREADPLLLDASRREDPARSLPTCLRGTSGRSMPTTTSSRPTRTGRT